MYMYFDMVNFALTIAYIKLKDEVHNWENFYVLTNQVYCLSVALEIHKNILHRGQLL